MICNFLGGSLTKVQAEGVSGFQDRSIPRLRLGLDLTIAERGTHRRPWIEIQRSGYYEPEITLQLSDSHRAARIASRPKGYRSSNRNRSTKDQRLTTLSYLSIPSDGSPRHAAAKPSPERPNSPTHELIRQISGCKMKLGR